MTDFESLVSSTQFLKDIVKETSTECLNSGIMDIPTVELKDVSLDEQELLHHSLLNMDMDSSNSYSILEREIKDPRIMSASISEKMDLLMRVYDKLDDGAAHQIRLQQTKNKYSKLLQEIEKFKMDIHTANMADSASGDITLLREEAELDRLELLISKLKCNSHNA